jgi:ribosomal protein L11 methyltransferase
MTKVQSKVPLYELHTAPTLYPLSLPNGQEKAIEITPGMAFGTGNHTTTVLCIKLLDHLLKGTNIENVLDVGCGSGILAICAVALGAKTAQGFDIKISIVNEARENVARNGLSSKIEVHLGTIEAVDDKFDLITANILIDLIDLISNELASRMKPNGHLIISGFRNKHRDDVIKKFVDSALILKYQLHDDEWSALLFSKSK